MRFKRINDEVLMADDQIVKVAWGDIESLKNKVVSNQNGRIRLCAHRNVNATLHEMLIVLTNDTYIRPHKHLDKSESFHVIEGFVDVVVFDEDGNIIEVIQMGDYASGRTFYYRIVGPFYHTLIVRSENLVFHETTNGPFSRHDTILAPWAPAESDSASGKKWVQQLSQAVENFVPLREERISD